MKVEKILCDICGEEIIEPKNIGYKMTVVPSDESCMFDKREIDVCEKCLLVLQDMTIKRGDKDYFAFNKLIKTRLTAPAVWN